MKTLKKDWHHIGSMIVIFSCADAPTIHCDNIRCERVIDGKGTVSGFIETNGTIGPLLAPNFIDWNLPVNIGSHILNLLGPKSGANSTITVTGNTTKASAKEIQFDCSGDQARIEIINPLAASPENGWALVGDFGGLVHDQFEEMCFLCSSSNPAAVTEHRSGIIKFPTLTNRIPQPSN